MNVLRRFGLPILVIAPVIAAVAALWNYLLLFAHNQGVKILVYLSMCLLALAAAAAAQYLIPDYALEQKADEKPSDDSDEGNQSRSLK